MNPVTSKNRMYPLLASGAFGNTIPQFFSVAAWRASGDSERYPTWGVRTLSPGGPCRLYCPTAEVESTVADYEARGHGVNISLMIDAVCTVTLYADVYEGERGVEVHCVENPGKGASWRVEMPRNGKRLTGLAAKMTLQRHLNPSSLADLYALLEQYPGHVVELSACDRCIGTIPGRNAVTWECRQY